MWKAKLFGSLPTLLDFVNGHGLEHHQFKVAVVPPRAWQRRGGPRYYLIYRAHEPEPILAGAIEAELGKRIPIDEETAVDRAAEIIHNAQHRDDPRRAADPDKPR